MAMADYISRQKAIEAIMDLPNCPNGYSDTYDKACIIGMLEEVPTADVVKVVRCKYCKHRKGTFHTDRRRKEGGYWIYWCKLDTGDPFELGRNAEDDNWFCADGKRRDNEDR